MGLYRFYQDGDLVGECWNILTTSGRQAIYNYMAQNGAGYARAIVVGAGDTAATVADQELEFEVEAAEIVQSAPDFVNDEIVFKARLPQELIMDIREIGLHSNFETPLTTSDEAVLFFTSEEEEWDNGTFESANARMGGEALRLSAAAATTEIASLVDLSYDFSEMAANQNFVLAVYVGDANCDSISVRFGVDASNYYEITESSPSSGYQIIKLMKKDAVETGTSDWSNITQISVSVTGTGGTTTVDFDGLRTQRFDPADEIGVLVSRSVPAEPIVKNSESPMDIEYRISVSVA